MNNLDDFKKYYNIIDQNVTDFCHILDSYEDLILNLFNKDFICFKCGNPGKFCFDPCDLEVYDNYRLVCLCDDCFKERYFDI